MKKESQEKMRDGEEPAEGKKTTKEQPSSSGAIILLSLALIPTVLILLSAISYYQTETFTFALNWRRYMPERSFTLVELSQYDGSDPDTPIFIALDGIFI